MITDKNGNEIRLIKIEDLCRTCMCNSQDGHKIIWDENIIMPKRRGYLSTCTNKADGCDGFTMCETCPMWVGLQSVFLTNVC